jgi:5-methylcytosine-specific restriction protein B
VSLADEIRSFTYKHFILPELWFHGCSSFTAGDVHAAMEFSDRVPAVCSALGSRTFLSDYKLRLIRRSGRPVSTRTHFVFAASAEHSLPDVSTQHLEAFRWFERNTGKVVTWT